MLPPDGLPSTSRVRSSLSGAARSLPDLTPRHGARRERHLFVLAVDLDDDMDCRVSVCLDILHGCLLDERGVAAPYEDHCRARSNFRQPPSSDLFLSEITGNRAYVEEPQA